MAVMLAVLAGAAAYIAIEDGGRSSDTLVFFLFTLALAPAAVAVWPWSKP